MKKELYAIVNTEDLCGTETLLTKEEVIEYYNEMVKAFNEEFDEETEENPQPTKDFETAKNNLLIFLEKVYKVDDDEFNPVVELFNRAIQNNTQWVGKTKETNNGFYNFAVKPLYIHKEHLTIQIKVNKMTPSGLSDNGIKYVNQYTISKYVFKEPKKLVKYLVDNILRHRTEPNEKTIKYIEF